MNEHQIIAAVQEYEQGGTQRKGSHTIQTRRLIKALTLIGVKRSDFRARVGYSWHRSPDGTRYKEYEDATASIWSREASKLVIDNAKLLNRCGVSVHIIEGASRTTAFVSSSHPYRTTRYNSATNTISYDG